jgi:SAM-dependent methyltransferase
MLASAVRSLFRRSSPRSSVAALQTLVPRMAQPEPPVEPPVEAPKGETRVPTAWPAGRLALVHELWGAGFIFPGGEIETLRLTRPLGISNAASLLMIGVGSGGPALSVTRNLGAWVTGMDTDPSLVAAAVMLVKRAQLDKKVTIKAWDPENPAFVARSHHHCLALEPFHGAHPEPIIASLAQALRPGGQMVITELTAPVPLDTTDPTVRRWGELEKRKPANVLAATAITRMLGRVGLDVRISEDMSERHLEHAMLGWRVMLRDLGRKPSRQEAVPMVAEAELWLLRRRLIREGRLQMMRWHAISTAAAN